MSTLYPTKAGLGLDNGKFTNGNDAAGILPSVLDADHINLLTDNVQGAIQGAGLSPNNQDGDQLQKSLNWAAGIWQEDTKYLAGQETLHSGALHTSTAPHTASAANAPGQANAPWERSDKRTTALEATNIGKTANQPVFKFVANDWKDRPIGWRGMIGPGSAGSPDATDYFYVEKVSNHEKLDGYYWQAYPVGKKSYFYVGDNSNPATQNGGLPYWEKYESFHKDSFIEYVKQYIYPVGSVYISATLTKSPATVLGFGSWVVIPAGHALATPGDGLALGKTVGDQVGSHSHAYWRPTNWHRYDNGSYSRTTRATGEFHTWASHSGTSPTRGKRFGVNMWRRTS